MISRSAIGTLGLLALLGCAGSSPSDAALAAARPDAPADAPWSPAFNGDPTACHDVEVPLATYCEFLMTCTPLGDWVCTGQRGIVSETIEEGCGYVRFTYRGDVGDVWGRTYDRATGHLLYLWSNGRLSAGCRDAVRAGQEPVCAAWTVGACGEASADGGASAVPSVDSR